MEHEESADRERSDGRRRRDRIVIQLPQIDAGLRDFLAEMVPGRALFRVLSNMPEDVMIHTRNARRERLLALRSLIDGLIEETDQPVRHQRAQEVEIE